MLGAIAGDIIGSIYEHNPIKHKEFPLFSKYCQFTDDTVLTVAVAQAILQKRAYVETVYQFAQLYPDAGYGGSFIKWMMSSSPEPYNSWGNGSAMRVSPVGFAFASEEKVLEEAKLSAEITHNHPEGIKGAQATALAILLARNKASKEDIRSRVEALFGYDLQRSVDEIRPEYGFDVSCQGTVPEAIISFLDSDSYEDAIRNAVSLGGDSDTLACITGGIAESYYGGVPEAIADWAMQKLPPDLVEVVTEFNETYLR